MGSRNQAAGSNDSSEHARQERERAQIRDWLAALDEVIDAEGRETAEKLLRQLQQRAAARGVELPFEFTTPYVNTIAPADEPAFDGDPELEQRILNLVRWNAMAMVVRANKRLEGIGGHIGSYTSISDLFEVGFNHFFRGKNHPEGPDKVYVQGHASTGVYARAFLEGRLDEEQLENFRRELVPEGGLSSYPHPWLMPDFWEFPTVSMGLSPLMAIYQARMDRYLENRGLVDDAGRVWALCGDGEFDEPEARGAINIAAREDLDNLTLIIDCNLQRLDGPVRGNSKVIQELESTFLGAGWRVIKVLWDRHWDELLERDADGVLVDHLEQTVDGQWQRYTAEGGAYLREHFFGRDPGLERLVEGMSDHQLDRLARGRGGHDLHKVFAAYRAAEREDQRPTVILAHTIKGLGLGEAGESRNIAHKAKSLDEEQLRYFRDRFDVPIGDDEVGETPFYRPAPDSREVKYIQERREKLGGYVPRRKVQAPPLEMPEDAIFDTYVEEGSAGRPATTTMILVRMLAELLKDDDVGELIVPIVPDEARTFGIEALFPQAGIYSATGQQYDPVDADMLLSYKESTDGQILEEGITEAGAMSSFIAAGSAYATHGLNTIPFFFFYSMFGFQRIGDLIWAAADQRTRGFLIGATSGRTTLNGEGLQHEDGHSHLIAYTNPNVRAYDPCFAHELAVIVRHGLEQMYVDGEDVMYYVTVANEDFEHPGLEELEGGRVDRDGIIRGMYRYRPSRKSGKVRRVQLLGAGPLLREALEAQRILEDDFGVTADVWSVTSWKALYEDALAAERHNRLDPDAIEREPYFTQKLGDDPGPVVCVSDFVKALPYSLARFCPTEMVALGTDGFGRSDSRQALREFFEVDAKHIALAALRALVDAERFPAGRLQKAVDQLGIDPDKANPMTT